MKKIITLFLLFILTSAYSKTATAQPVNLPEASDRDNAILDLDGDWMINRVLETKNNNNETLSVSVTFAIPSKDSVFYSSRIDEFITFTEYGSEEEAKRAREEFKHRSNNVAFSMEFFAQKYRSKECVLEHQEDKNDLIKITVNDKEQINPTEQSFVYLDADYDEGEYIHQEEFISEIHFSDVKRMATAKRLNYKVCGDTYHLSVSAIKELNYFVNKVEEAAKKYNHNLE